MDKIRCYAIEEGIMSGSLDDMKAWDKNGKEISPAEFIKEGVSRGFVQDGQIVLHIRMAGKVETWTMLATNKKYFIKMMKHIAKMTYV